MSVTLRIVDLFCGAGGTSTGILKAAQRLGVRVNLTAVNHWTTAINTHSLNHPSVTHLCENVENLHPLDLAPDGLDVLAASCECRYHSNARGGGPCNEQSRSQAWQLTRWATDVRVKNILMENVREFLNWGPLLKRAIVYKGKSYKKDRPDPRRKGEFFNAFVATLRGLFRHVEWRLQIAANYGDATTRERLMLIASQEPITWPEFSHGPASARPWRTARECIDWSLKGTSIFERKKPLCQNTMDRIAAGLKKFGGPAAQPFLVILRGTGKSHINSCAREIDAPIPTITAGGNHVALVEPFLAAYHNGPNPRIHSVDEPLRTQDTSNRYALVEPFITHLTHQGGHESRCHSVDKPLPTVTAAHRGEMALVQPFIAQTDQQSSKSLCCRTVDQPIGTVVSKQSMLLVEPMVVKYYRTGRCKPVDAPLDTITTKARFMLVECGSGREVAELDIRTRMLQPHELAAAHSFPSSYKFLGSQEDKTTQIGNSVPVELAAAHAEAILRNL